MERYKRILLTIVAIIGFITSIKLTVIFYETNYNPYALNSFCSINNFVDCDGVARTAHAVFLGIPLAVWGLILYSIFLILTYADKLKEIKLLQFLEVFKNQTSYIFTLGLIAFFISMTLAFISIFEINKICILCFFTYILNLVIAIIAGYKSKRIDDLFADCIKDFYSAIKIKKYLIAFVAVCIVGISALYYTSTSFIFAPHMKKISEFEKLRRTKTNPYKVKGNILGDKDAKLVVYIYSDFQCPACTMFNITVHKAAHELKNVKFIHKNFPLDKACNTTMQYQMHPGSCTMAKYAIAAGKQNKYWEMSNMLYEKKPKSKELLLKYAKNIGIDTTQLEKDATSQETEKQLKNEIDFALKNNLNATPVLQIGMKQLPGVTPYDKLELMLIEAGARKR